jgi:hypothetical protein
VAKPEDLDRLYAAVADRGQPSTYCSPTPPSSTSRASETSPKSTSTTCSGIEILANLVFAGPTAVDQFTELQKNTVPLARMAEADEVAKAVVFLASDLSSFTTAADIPVDGGVNQIQRRRRRGGVRSAHRARKCE